MIRISTQVIILAMTASIASAADVTIYEPTNDAPFAAHAYSWSGIYAGVNAGYKWGTFGVHIEGDGGSDGWMDDDLAMRIRNSGFMGGGQIGYNHQINNLVLGVEADLQYVGRTSNAVELTQTIDFGGGPFDIETRTKAGIEWFGTVRGRIGYAMDRTLVYATGGLAYGRTRVHYEFDGPGDIFDYRENGSEMHLGYAVGAGVEQALTDTLSVKLEYLYTDLGKKEIGFTDAVHRDTVRYDAHAVRVGLNVRF